MSLTRLPLTRRAFMKNGAMAVVGAAAVPTFLTRSVLAQATTAQAQGKKLVVIFQRGAADGLNIVVPWREKTYYDLRPTIAIPQNQVIDLDGFFGLHPAMQPIKPLWDQGHLAIIHACGSPDPSRSHFDAQDFMESGTPGLKSTPDGWLNRALAAEDATHPHHKESAFRAIALGSQLPRTLEGRIPAVAIDNVKSFNVGGQNPAAVPLAASFESMYDDSVNAILHGTGTETFEAVKMLKATDPANYVPSAGANYPNGQFGQSMKQIAQLLKANLGVEAAFADIGGWTPTRTRAASTASWPTASRNSASRSRPSGPTWATTPRTSPSSPCPNSAAPPARTAPRHRPRPRQRNVRLGGSVAGRKVYGNGPEWTSTSSTMTATSPSPPTSVRSWEKPPTKPLAPRIWEPYFLEHSKNQPLPEYS